MVKKNKLQEQEWSSFFNVEKLGDEAIEVSISANEEQRKDLCARLSVNELQSLTADLKVERAQGGHVVHAIGQLQASLGQDCVVTMEPVETNLVEDVEGWFADRDNAVSFIAAKREREVEKTVGIMHGEVEVLAEEDEPEAIVDGMIDLGELVTQFLSLSIPAYPHKEGAVHELSDEDIKGQDHSVLKKNPFEALKDWKETR